MRECEMKKKIDVELTLMHYINLFLNLILINLLKGTTNTVKIHVHLAHINALQWEITHLSLNVFAPITQTTRSLDWCGNLK